MSENKQITFLLKKVKTEQFAIIEENFKESEIVELNTMLQFKISHERKAIGAFIKLSYEILKNPFLLIEVSCHFNITENDWLSFDKSKNESGQETIIIPKGLLAHLGMITVGTSRGVLHAKTEGTIFNKFIVPTLNVVEMVKEDGAFSKTEKD